MNRRKSPFCASAGVARSTTRLLHFWPSSWVALELVPNSLEIRGRKGLPPYKLNCARFHCFRLLCRNGTSSSGTIDDPADTPHVSRGQGCRRTLAHAVRRPGFTRDQISRGRQTYLRQLSRRRSRLCAADWSAGRSGNRGRSNSQAPNAVVAKDHASGPNENALISSPQER